MADAGSSGAIAFIRVDILRSGLQFPYRLNRLSGACVMRRSGNINERGGQWQDLIERRRAR
jgi:hypothetical protein